MDTLAQALYEIVKQYNTVEQARRGLAIERARLNQRVINMLEKETWHEEIEEEMVITNSNDKSWLITIDLEDFRLVNIHLIPLYKGD